MSEVLWILILLMILFAIFGGIVLSKFLFLLLIVAVIVAIASRL
jgi:hypothetical protein